MPPVLSLLFLVGVAKAQPTVLFTDVETGPKSGGPNNQGVPISIFGSGFGTQRGTSRVTIGGIEVASYLAWGKGLACNRMLDMIVVQPGANVVGGKIVVQVAGVPSNGDQSFVPNQGRVLYVATNGADTNPGTELAPFATLLYAVARARSGPGDAILVRGGVYSEGEIWIRESEFAGGTPGQAKAIVTYPGETAVFANPARDLILDAAYLTVSGLHLRNGKAMGMYDSATGLDFKNGVKLVNNSVVGSISYEGMGTHGSHHTIAGNLILVSGSSVGTQGHCIYISVGTDIRLLHNVVSGAPGYGIHVFDQCRSTSDYRRVIKDVLIEGNLLHGSRERSGVILAMNDECSLGNGIENVTIRNNLFVANNHVGLVVRGATKNVRVYNNTFYENGRQDLYLGPDANLQDVDIVNNLFFHTVNANCTGNCSWFPQAHVQVEVGPSNVVLRGNGYHPTLPTILGATDPASVTGPVYFVSTAGFDFRVLPPSASIDAGRALALVPRDLFGVTRPQGPHFDLGAFEWMESAPIAWK